MSKNKGKNVEHHNIILTCRTWMRASLAFPRRFGGSFGDGKREGSDCRRAMVNSAGWKQKWRKLNMH